MDRLLSSEVYRHSFLISAESYLKFVNRRITIEYFSAIPIISYGILLAYIIHSARNVALNTRKINKKTLSFKKKLAIAVAVYTFYQFCFMIYCGYYIESGDLLLCLLLNLFEIFIAVFTPNALRKISKRVFEIPYPKYFLYFWSFYVFKLLLEIANEFFLGFFFKLVTFSSVGVIATLSLVYMLYKFPRDDMYPSNNEVLHELQQYLPMISQGNYSFHPGSIKMSSMRKFRSINSMDKLEKLEKLDQVKKFKHSPASTNTNNFFKDVDISLDDISQTQPEMLPHYPKIEIVFKDYFKYYQQNDSTQYFQEANHKQNNHGNNFDFAQNFFFQIIVKVPDKNLSRILKRSIQDFLDLQHSIKSEFSFDRYNKKLCERVPSLKIPKNFQSLDFYKNYKINFEIFLKSIINEPCFITDDVLWFLEIDDERMKFSYNLARKKVLNVTRITDDTFMNKQLSVDFSKNEDDFIIRESVKNLKTDLKILMPRTFESIKNTPVVNLNIPQSNSPVPVINLKLSVLEINKDVRTASSDYTVVIRVAQNLMFRIINKKLSEIMKMINEIAGINKNNENIKNLVKMYKDGEFAVSNINFKKFHTLLENVLQNCYDNLKIYSSNCTVCEFFSDFVESTLSRCESFVVKEEKKNSKPEKKETTYYYDLINSNKIESVSADVTNYIFLTLEFKPHVFYVTRFRIKLKNGKIEELTKKFKYKELNEYINLMRIKLGIFDKLDKKLPKSSQIAVFKNTDDKIKFRKTELQKNLNEIFSILKIEETRAWGEILVRDKRYKDLKSKKHQKELSQNRPSFIFNRRTESKESYLGLNIRDSIL